MDMVIALKEPLFSQTESQVFGRSVWLGPVVDCINGSHLPAISKPIAMHLCNAFLLWLWAQFCDLFWPKHSVLVLRRELKTLCMFHFSSGTASIILRACLSQPHWFQRRIRDTWSRAESLKGSLHPPNPNQAAIPAESIKAVLSSPVWIIAGPCRCVRNQCLLF